MPVHSPAINAALAGPDAQYAWIWSASHSRAIFDIHKPFGIMAALIASAQECRTAINRRIILEAV
jgi:hypothetical protein